MARVTGKLRLGAETGTSSFSGPARVPNSVGQCWLSKKQWSGGRGVVELARARGVSVQSCPWRRKGHLFTRDARPVAGLSGSDQ